MVGRGQGRDAEQQGERERAVIEASEAEDKLTLAAEELAFEPRRLEEAEARLLASLRSLTTTRQASLSAMNTWDNSPGLMLKTTSSKAGW